jgi:cytochrome c oxidase assembly factor CtaG/polyferredoxin
MNSSIAQAAWSSWSIPFWPTALLLLTAYLYLRGWRKIRRTRPREFPAWRAWCFLSGLVSIWIAIASPLDTLDGLLLVAHMTQHLILMSVAPPLLLLGAPSVPLLRALPRSALRDALGPFFRAPWPHQVFRRITHPVFAWVVMNLAYLAWHVPQAYELALRSPAWHGVEHACFLGTSLLFWFPVIQPWPSVAQGSRWIMLPYLVGADLVNTGVAAFLTFAGRVVYPSYAAGPRLFGITALGDQVAAGALMWVVGSILYLLPLVAIVLHLLSPKSQRVVPCAAAAAARVVQSTRAPAPAPRLDLLRLPLIGGLLRARYGRMALQSIAFVAAALVIADGFVGHPMGAMNLAGVLPWTWIRPIGVIALLALGNIFCMSCPFMLPRELGHRLGLARYKWPRWLRSKWMAVALILLFFWSYEEFALWDHPMRTAWLLLGYFAAAFAVDTFFRGASFCKYVCPLGQFNFAASLLAPFTLEARSLSTCGSCTTHDCIAGNPQQRGCELQLYMPQKVGNMDCTLCMDCVKACPHDNIGLVVGSPLRDLLRDPVRSSVGKFSTRLDIAALALVVVLGAFANAVVMVTPQRGVAAGGSLTMLLGVALASLAAVRLLGGAQSPRDIFCRFSLALLPLGMMMWAAHLLFHLFTGWQSLSPALHQAAADIGLHLLASPRWAGEHPLLSANHMLSIQLLLLDMGLLLTLYLGWRLARQWAVRSGRALLVLLPWAATVAVAYAAGVWILLQPMQMRGMIMTS